MAIQWNRPWVSECERTPESESSSIIREWGETMSLWPHKGLLTMVGLWNQVSEQDNVLLTILTGQFGWHILGIFTDSMTATCTPSTNPHLQLQMVHNFFPVFITALGGGGNEGLQPSCPSQVSVQSCWTIVYPKNKFIELYWFKASKPYLKNYAADIHRHYLAKKSHLRYIAYHWSLKIVKWRDTFLLE